MAVYNSEIIIKSKGENDIIDITEEVQMVVSTSGLKEGLCNIFVAGSTGTISTIEYEDGLKHDFPKILDKIAPKTQEYLHHETWHDDNGRSFSLTKRIAIGKNISFYVSSNHNQWALLSTVSGITCNSWHYIVATFNNGQMKIYVDGILNNLWIFPIRCV